MNVDPYLNLTYEKRKKVKKEIQDRVQGKKKSNFGKEIFKAMQKAWSQEYLEEEATTTNIADAAGEELTKSLDREILENASDDIKIAAIKQDIEAGREGIKGIWAAVGIYMPQTHGFLENYTESEFKRVMLVHKFLGHWMEFPTIGQLGNKTEEAKKYFKTYLHLLEDRGVEQDKHFHYTPLKTVWTKDEEENIPRQLRRVLDEDEEGEKYNELGEYDAYIQRFEPAIYSEQMEISVSAASVPAVSGQININYPTLEIQVFDGTKWDVVDL
jgi:hypothetical protein